MYAACLDRNPTFDALQMKQTSTSSYLEYFLAWSLSFQRVALFISSE